MKKCDSLPWSWGISRGSIYLSSRWYESPIYLADRPYLLSYIPHFRNVVFIYKYIGVSMWE
jgi:hypothetical protein